MIAKMYCMTVAGQATEPGVTTKIVRLQAIQGKPAANNKPATLGGNEDIFKDGSGNVAVEMVNVSATTAAEFEEGGVYELTLKRVS